MSVPLFVNRPSKCPYGHSVKRGMPQRVGWKPCQCAIALEAAADGCGMGHLLIICGSCHEERQETTFYEPPHDIKHREPGMFRPAGTVLPANTAVPVPGLEPHLRLIVADGLRLVPARHAARLPRGLQGRLRS